MLGWRKLSAWLLVYLLVLYMSAFAKFEIPTNNMELIKWVTGFFFGANALKPLFQNSTVKIGTLT
jgi:hypothetical protein